MVRVLEQSQIEDLIPHRGWALFVESACIDGLTVQGTARWDPAHPHLAGHFPGFPIVPGIFLIEAFAQLAGTALVCNGLASANQVGMLTGVKRVVIHRPVLPDERVYYALTITHGADGRFFVAAGLGRNERQEKVITVDATIAIVDPSSIWVARASS